MPLTAIPGGVVGGLWGAERRLVGVEGEEEEEEERRSGGKERGVGGLGARERC